MNTHVTTSRGIKIYNISSDKTIPFWISLHSKRKKTRKGRTRPTQSKYTLIHDYDFPTAVEGLVFTGDGKYILGHGLYPPQIKCWEFEELGLKFSRHVDEQIVAMEMLTEDYGKFCTISNDRNVSIHAPFGLYHKVRTPKVGRSLLYQRHSCELLICGNGGDVFRLNMHAGRFVKPFETGATALNKCAENDRYKFFSFGSDDGVVHTFDARSNERVCVHSIDTAVKRAVTDLAYSGDGLTLAVGTNNGMVYFYDIRSAQPYMSKDMMNGSEIVSMQFLDSNNNREEPLLLVADRQSVKFISRNDGALFAGVDAEERINTAKVYEDSGYLVIGGEKSNVKNYYIPELGPAPVWCSFLDSITQELDEEEKMDTAFEDYRFVTNSELESLGLTHLRGTTLLRAYMHGYFISERLYAKVGQMMASDEQVSEQVTKDAGNVKETRRGDRSLDKGARADSIGAVNVNQDYATIVDTSGEPEGTAGREFAIDERFSKVFEDPNFAIEEGTDLYRRIQQQQKKQKKKEEDAFPGAGIRRIDDLEGSSGEVSLESEEESVSEGLSGDDDSDDEDILENREMETAIPEIFKAAQPSADNINLSFGKRIKASGDMPARRQSAKKQGKARGKRRGRNF